MYALKYMLSFALIALLRLPANANAETTTESCLTATTTVGLCVPINHCSYMALEYRKYEKTEMSPIFKSFLNKSICKTADDADDLYVCCDASAFPEQKSIAAAKEQTTAKRHLVVRRQAANDDQFRTIDERGLNILDNVPKCGSRVNQKLSGGDNASLGEFPWMALLEYDTNYQPFKCGGSVITERYILTAAHCVVGVYYDLIGVRLGEHSIAKERDCEFRGKRERCSPPVQNYGIAAQKPHPLYRKGSINNDIALIKVDRRIEFQVHIKPVCLPITQKSKKLAYDQRFFIAGWGTTEHGSSSDSLLKAVVQQKPLDVCRTAYKSDAITHNHICAAGDEKIESCRGDSGGPLFFLVPYKNTPRYTQYGVVSFGGARCGKEQSLPGVYANVLDMLPWITHNVD